MTLSEMRKLEDENDLLFTINFIKDDNDEIKSIETSIIDTKTNLVVSISDSKFPLSVEEKILMIKKYIRNKKLKELGI